MPRRLVEESDGKSARQLIAALFKPRVLMTVFKRARKCDKSTFSYVISSRYIPLFPLSLIRMPEAKLTPPPQNSKNHKHDHKLSDFIYRYPSTRSFIPEKSIIKEELFSSAAVSNTNEHIKRTAKTPQHPVISPPL